MLSHVLLGFVVARKLLALFDEASSNDFDVVLCGLLFWHVTNDLAGFQNRLGCLFFMCALLAFGSLSSLELFSEERLLFVRERANGYYYPSAFFFAKILFDLFPLRIIPSLILGVISYFMVGFSYHLSDFLRFLLVLVLFNMVAAAMCLLVATACKRLAMANLVAILVMLFSMLFGGFLLNKGAGALILAVALYLSISSQTVFPSSSRGYRSCPFSITLLKR